MCCGCGLQISGAVGIDDQHTSVIHCKVLDAAASEQDGLSCRCPADLKGIHLLPFEHTHTHTHTHTPTLPRRLFTLSVSLQHFTHPSLRHSLSAPYHNQVSGEPGDEVRKCTQDQSPASIQRHQTQTAVNAGLLQQAAVPGEDQPGRGTAEADKNRNGQRQNKFGAAAARHQRCSSPKPFMEAWRDSSTAGISQVRLGMTIDHQWCSTP